MVRSSRLGYYSPWSLCCCTCHAFLVCRLSPRPGPPWRRVSATVIFAYASCFCHARSRFLKYPYYVDFGAEVVVACSSSSLIISISIQSQFKFKFKHSISYGLLQSSSCHPTCTGCRWRAHEPVCQDPASVRRGYAGWPRGRRHQSGVAVSATAQEWWV